MKRDCKHERRTVPTNFRVRVQGARVKGSQENMGLAEIRICLECGHVVGRVVNDSLVTPFGPYEFESGPSGIEDAAWLALIDGMARDTAARLKESVVTYDPAYVAEIRSKT
jgi:hypothetical protein